MLISGFAQVADPLRGFGKNLPIAYDRILHDLRIEENVLIVDGVLSLPWPWTRTPVHCQCRNVPPEIVSPHDGFLSMGARQ